MRLFPWVATVVVIVVAPVSSAAQNAPPRGWRARVLASAEARYDDNPFLLTASRKLDLAQPSASDIANGRFADMTNPHDAIVTPGFTADLRGTGIGGHDLQVELDAAYELNLQNARRRHFETRLTVDQDLGDGRLRFRSGLRPSYFSKNYLADAVDQNGDNRIASAERRYAAAVSSELELWLTYRHRLSKATKQRPVGVTFELGTGYADRAFQDPFPGRSRRGPGALAGLSVTGRKWTVDLDYTFAAMKADVTREVLLLDEPEFGTDFNGNGSATDLDARAFELVDRSRLEHELDLAIQGELSRRVTLEIAYGHRLRHYQSTQPFDVSDRGRDDTLNEIAAELGVHVHGGLDVAWIARLGGQHTNRPADPGAAGDVTDYTRREAGMIVRYRFAK